MRRRTTAIAAVAGLLVLGGGLPASAGDVTGKDPAGDVEAKGLTKAERDAIDIVSVRAIGEEGKGAVVIVTFKGDFQKAMGRGHLKHAAAALVLTPRASSQLPAGLVTFGAGAGKTLRRTSSERVGSGRLGHQLAFVIAGPGFGSVASIDVKTFANAPPLSARTTAGRPRVPPPRLSDSSWTAIRQTRASDTERLRADAGPPGICGRLNDIRALPILKVEQLTELTGDVLLPCAPGPPTTSPLEANFAWRFFGTSPDEIVVSGTYTSTDVRSFDAVRVVIPPAGSSPRAFTNFLPPPQLPGVALSQTASPDDTITFSDGTFTTGEQLQFNLRFSGAAGTDDMRLQVFTGHAGEFEGPFDALKAP